MILLIHVLAAVALRCNAVGLWQAKAHEPCRAGGGSGDARHTGHAGSIKRLNRFQSRGDVLWCACDGGSSQPWTVTDMGERVSESVGETRVSLFSEA